MLYPNQLQHELIFKLQLICVKNISAFQYWKEKELLTEAKCWHSTHFTAVEEPEGAERQRHRSNSPGI